MAEHITLGSLIIDKPSKERGRSVLYHHHVWHYYGGKGSLHDQALGDGNVNPAVLVPSALRTTSPWSMAIV